MAVSESVLNAVNLFSSTSVFNANKGSVGATDLNFIKQTTAELATEGGGIIAQSLGTNGYVKFANGLILQWGVATGNGNTNSPTVVTLPIPFTSSIYIANAGQGDLSYGGYGQAWVSVDQTTNSSIQIRWCYSVKAYWIVIGIQQWGKVVGVAKNTTLNLNINYNSTNFWVDLVTLDTGSGGDAYANWVGEPTLTTFVVKYYNTALSKKNILWLSIGL